MSDDRRGMALDGVPGLVQSHVDPVSGEVIHGQRGLTTMQDLLEDEAVTGTLWRVVYDGQNITARFIQGNDVDGWVEVHWGLGTRRWTGPVIFVPTQPWHGGG